MTLREAMRRPLTKPALRKIDILESTRCVTQTRQQWFVFTPRWDGPEATPVPTFQMGLEYLRSLRIG